MGFLIHSAFTEFVIFIVTLIVVIISYFYNRYKYWDKRGVPTIPPHFPLGNTNVILPRGFTFGFTSKAFYDYLKLRGHKFGGIYLVTQPNLVIVDPEYVKDILSKDFQYFVDRGFYFNEKDDPVSANLFALDGNQWKNLRVKVTPTFTSSKMKMMFETVIEKSNNMLNAIEKNLDFDVKEIMGRFTTDVIGSCAFGVECNSFKYPDAEFRKMGIRIFHFDFWRSVRAFFIINLPTLSHWLRLTNNNKDVREFFINLVADTIELRNDPKNKRNDFLQILLDMKDSANLTVNEMAAQVFLFFLAGFESSSSVITFTLYELAKHPEYQNRLREEIREILQKYDGQITYESLSEMKYLGQVFEETIRIYPPGSTLNRRCVKDYTLRDTNIVIEKGTPILIPALGLHMDPEYFPNPQKFDPDRFSDEMKQLRHSHVYLPFGDGPRNCIGLRFGHMQSKIGIASVIKNYKLSISPNTKPVRLDTSSFILRTMDPVYLRAVKV